MKNADLVRTIYDRFMHGDVASILAKFDDAIEFRLAEGHPYQPSGRAWIGKDAVTEHFFNVAGPEWEGWTISIAALIETPDAVIVEGRYTGTYKPTGNAMDVQVCHVWRLRGGRVTSFHQYVDTASLQHVMGRAK
jgi:uncharacterized protein